MKNLPWKSVLPVKKQQSQPIISDGQQKANQAITEIGQKKKVEGRKGKQNDAPKYQEEQGRREKPVF